MVESALHSSHMAACGMDGGLYQQENPGSIHLKMLKANSTYKKSCFFCLNTKNAKASSPPSHQFVRSQGYCYQGAVESFPDVLQELETKAWFQMHFCNDSTSLVWDAVAVLNFMVILHADRSYFLVFGFFYFTNRKHQYLACELSKQFQLSQ